VQCDVGYPYSVVKGCLYIFAKLFKKYIYKILHLHKYSVFLGLLGLGTPVFGEFLPFVSADLIELCLVGWGVLLHSYSQVRSLQGCSIGFKFGLCLGHSRIFRGLSLLRCLGCVLWVVILIGR
jgi:hypothetical protein